MGSVQVEASSSAHRSASAFDIWLGPAWTWSVLVMVWAYHRLESRHQARPASAGELDPVEASLWVHRSASVFDVWLGPVWTWSVLVMVWECHRFESRHQAHPASAGELAPVEASS